MRGSGDKGVDVLDVRLTCQPGDPTRPNEDAVVAVPGLLAVLDGVTAPEGVDTGCRHDPAWYVRQLAAHLAVEHLTGPERALAEVVAVAIEATRTAHRGCDPNLYGPQSTVALLRVRPDWCDYLLLGDCTIVLDRSGRVETVTDLRSHEVRHRLQPFAAERTPLGSRERAERHRAVVLAQRRHANTPGGYWVAAADPAAAAHAVQGSIRRGDLDGLDRAALLTDGASAAVDEYDRTDWRGLLDLIESRGADEVVTLARAAEQSDPEGLRWPRPKRHDDATVAFCRLIR